MQANRSRCKTENVIKRNDSIGNVCHNPVCPRIVKRVPDNHRSTPGVYGTNSIHAPNRDTACNRTGDPYDIRHNRTRRKIRHTARQQAVGPAENIRMACHIIVRITVLKNQVGHRCIITLIHIAQSAIADNDTD